MIATFQSGVGKPWCDSDHVLHKQPMIMTNFSETN